MDLGKIVVSSFKYPFRNLRKLPVLFLLFILISVIPIGMVYDNRCVTIIGLVAFFAFVLIVPGYLLSIVKSGFLGSGMMPSFDFGANIYDTVRLLVLRLVYMIVPVLVFFTVLSFGSSSMELLYEWKILSFLLSISFGFIIVVVTFIIFEVLLFFAKARLAYLNSLQEALMINKVVDDIRNIGIFNIIKWVIIMVILMSVFYFVASWVMSIPYVGFLIYIGIVIPIMESIGNYSLGLIYSNIARNSGELERIRRDII